MRFVNFFTKCLYYYTFIYADNLTLMAEVTFRYSMVSLDSVVFMSKFVMLDAVFFKNGRPFFTVMRRKKSVLKLSLEGMENMSFLGKKVRVLLQNIFLTFAHSWKAV